MKLSELHENLEKLPEVGYIYQVIPTDRNEDFHGLDLGVLGFRNAKTQVKVIFIDDEDVDNFDLHGRYRLELDPKSKRAPTTAEKELMDKAQERIKKLGPED